VTDAFTAAGAVFAEIAVSFGFGNAVASARADRGAGSASDALGRLIFDFRGGGQTFRIVAPLAAERAALEEDGRTDTGTVVDGEFLYVENASGHVIPHRIEYIDDFIIPICTENFK
jgi:hypothetical protein